MAALNPPETLTPPAPVSAIDQESAGGMVKLAPAKLSELDIKVTDFVADLLKSPVHGNEFQAKMASIHGLGNGEIRKAASMSQRMLDRPMSAMDNGVFNEGSNISKSLVDLRAKIEALDPGRHGDLLAPRKLLGIIPLGSKIQDYFRQYQSAQTHINAIIQSLYHGQDELRRDNAAVEEEKVNAWRTMEMLEQYIYMGKKIDVALSDRIADLEASDPEKARVIKEELLFYVRQKVQDLLTQLAVTIQGYLALDMIRKNNLELIKGVDRAATTTVSALRTAVIVAQALANQKLVLDQIDALNTTTGNMIETTSLMLKQQVGRVQEQAASTGVSIDKLKLAFQNVYQTMDMVSNYKLNALENMRQTVETLSTEIERSKTYLDRTRQETVAQVSSYLEVSPEKKKQDVVDI